MKLKLLPKLFMLTVLAGASVGCQKQDESKVHDTVVINTQLKSGTPATLVSGGTDQITIYATCGWSLECEGDWFTVEPSSGTKGISESVITTGANDTGAERVGTIRLKAGSYSSTYTFTQAAR